MTRILYYRDLLSQKLTSFEPQRLEIRMTDRVGSYLDMYGSVTVARSGSIVLALWVYVLHFAEINKRLSTFILGLQFLLEIISFLKHGRQNFLGPVLDCK